MQYYSDDLIKIRDIKDSDVNHLFRWWIDPELNKYDPRPYPNDVNSLLKEAEGFCKRFEEEIITECVSSRAYEYFIITNNDDVPIGFINFFNQKKEIGEGEMGIILGEKNYHNRGIGTKALLFITDYLFNKMNINRIYIETLESNLPAIRLFSKVNFNKCGEYVDEDLRAVVMEKRRNRS
ncbi:GNAT family N-acetyltransferase [Haloplasma contractile]|uniref:Diamine N-acetyltransferase protein n=1 Tax=Haloplasma contractile SSD-17B TaxID=1033810 RepID=U2EEJ7_9MOLU|nr:GNAT family N-acetyltransferase [Haloplasma contractile]ERJ13121.1 diamine N-acetyltransferase protein [Haloplasma contractile SSD-17B]